MQNTATIGFIGAGNMAYALISGLFNNNIHPRNIKISDVDKTLLSQRKREFGVDVFTDNAQLVACCDVVVLAVKPQVLSSVCKPLAVHLRHQPLIISIVAGVKIGDINRWLGGGRSLVRTMPNTAAKLGEGMSGMLANSIVNKTQKALAQQILGAVGSYLWVKDELMLDVVTALSGSGPAYFFLLIESMTNAGVVLGLSKADAQQLSVQTALGASMMAADSKHSVQHLRIQVTSPNGTTQAAIDALQKQNFEAIVVNAIRAAFDRARAIGIELGDD